MVERWQEEFPAPQPVFTQAEPLAEDVVWSLAHKIAVLAGVVALILGLWAMTSQPATSPPSDATLGPPIADPVQVGDVTP